MKHKRRLANTILMTGVFFSGRTWSAPDLLAQSARILFQESGAPVRSYMTFESGEEQDTSARSVLLPDKEFEQELLLRVRSKLGPGMVAFFGTIKEKTPRNWQVELVVARGVDQFEILRLARTNAVIYGLNTQAIIVKLRAWDKEFGIDIRHATTDQVHFFFKKLPKDRLEFVRRAVEFCPDLRKTFPTVPSIAASIYRNNDLVLWWD